MKFETVAAGKTDRLPDRVCSNSSQKIARSHLWR